ncbi:MAG TPA: POTRA domain-containing protein [Bryobacteraceae bacterium]|jgi:hypothetical protein
MQKYAVALGIGVIGLTGRVQAAGTLKTVSSVEIPGGLGAIPLQTKAGEALDPAKLSADVKTLWRFGHFSDIRVESVEDGEKIRVIFRPQNDKLFRLRKIEVKPMTPGIDLQIKPGSEITVTEAHEIAAGVRKRLESWGYASARVDAKFSPASRGRADLQILVDQGRRVDIDTVKLTGNLGAPGEDARKALRWTNGTTILPPVPGIWKGWRLNSTYTDNRVQSDAANLQSFYYQRGYFEATVKPTSTNSAATRTGLQFEINAGPRYAIRSIGFRGKNGFRPIQPSFGAGFPAGDVCKALLAERRLAERAGVLDFTAQIELRDVPGAAAAGGADARKWVDLEVTSERGPAYRVGRIEFRGNRSFSDQTIRRAFLFDEGDPLDQELLRKSLARLNNTGLFEPLSETNVAVNTPPGSDRADIFLSLRERKMRSWNLSGPVGPMSIGGPLTFRIGTRLPPWGWRLIELSTFTVSMNFMLLPKSVALLLPAFPHSGFLAAAVIQRPLLPGQPFFSGFSVAPQLGWQGVALGYGFSKARSLAGRFFAGNQSAAPALPVTIVRAMDGEPDVPKGVLYCEAPKPRFQLARKAGGFATGLFFSLAAF